MMLGPPYPLKVRVTSVHCTRGSPCASTAEVREYDGQTEIPCFDKATLAHDKHLILWLGWDLIVATFAEEGVDCGLIQSTALGLPCIHPPLKSLPVAERQGIAECCVRSVRGS